MPYGQKEERVKAEPIRKTRLTTSQKIKIALKCLDVLIKKYSKSFYDSDELKAIGNAKIGEIIHKTKTNDIEKFKGFICISLVNAFRNYIRDEKRKALCYKRIKNKEEVSPYIGDESNNKSRIKLKEAYIILEDNKNISIEIVNNSDVFLLKTRCSIEEFEKYYKKKGEGEYAI